MTEYFARQLTGSRCGPYNCGAASGAMASMFALGEAGITADEFPKRSGVSCVPGENSKSGGLFISHVERTATTYGVSIDYGRDPGGNQPKRWSEADAKTRLSGDFVGIFLGDYDQMGADSASPRSRATTRRSPTTSAPATTPSAGHDPLRTKPIRITWSRLMRYWRKPGSPVRGLAGFTGSTRRKTWPPTRSAVSRASPDPQGGRRGHLLGLRRRERDVPVGTPHYEAPGGKKPGAISNAATRFLLVGQDAKTSPKFYLLDGGTDGLMRWAPAAAAKDKRDDVKAAATKAAADTKTAAIKASLV